MTSNPSPAPTPDLATPRPWRARGTFIEYDTSVSTEVLGRQGMANQANGLFEVNTTGRYGTWEADRDLIVAAVNDYDRLRAIESAAKAWKAEQEALTAKWRAGEPGVHFEDMRVVQDAEEALFALLDAAIQGGSKT